MILQRWILMLNGKPQERIHDSYQEAKVAAYYVHKCGTEVEIAEVHVDVHEATKPEFEPDIWRMK